MGSIDLPGLYFTSPRNELPSATRLSLKSQQTSSFRNFSKKAILLGCAITPGANFQGLSWTTNQSRVPTIHNFGLKEDYKLLHISGLQS